MKRRIIFFLILMFFPLILVKADTTLKEVSFVRCVDGDTAVFNVDNEEVKFRFLAIDTPETVHPTKEVEAFGKNASEYTCNKLTNAQSIYVEYENSNKIDKYGRSLAWIWVDGSLLQKELVSVGYAEVAYIYGTYRYTESLCLNQKVAKESSYGIWSENREEGYCSTVDLTKTQDNIIWDNVDIPDNIQDNNEEIIPEEEIDNFTSEKLDKANDIMNKVDDYLTDNDSKFSRIFVAVFISIAAFYAVFKGKKK